MGAEASEDTARLLQRIAQGDREAFGSFYDRYAPLVFTFAVRLVRDRSEAEDLLQEVFLQAWRRAGTYSPARGSPEALILTLTRSRGIDKLRSIRRKDKSVLPIQEPFGSGGGGRLERDAPEVEARLTVQSVLAGLPEAQRMVLELAYFGGLTQSEIAAHLGEPLGTVKSRIRAGLGRLRELLGIKAAGGQP